MQLPIYLDNHATTMADPRVLDVMLPYFTKYYGNPSSRMHHYGEAAGNAVDAARTQVANLICAKDPKEILFTAGATEAINMALRGVAELLKDKGRHIITTAVEHKAVLKTCVWLETQGFTIEYLPVDQYGQVSVESVRSALRDDTILVAIMAANNEVGSLNPIHDIGLLLKDHQAQFFVDAAQAAGKVPLSVTDDHIDLLALSGHKFHGPKGIGALYLRKGGRPALKIGPLLHGGGQERGYRSGTLNVPGIVGMGEAARIAVLEMEQNARHMAELRDHLQQRLLAEVEEVKVNGHPTQRLPGNLNVSFTLVEGEGLAMRLKDVAAVSTGSACSSDTLEASYVLLAMGVDEVTAHSSIRIGLSAFTTREEIDCVADAFRDEVKRLRDMSPLWQMKKEGVDISSIAWKDH